MFTVMSSAIDKGEITVLETSDALARAVTLLVRRKDLESRCAGKVLTQEEQNDMAARLIRLVVAEMGFSRRCLLMAGYAYLLRTRQTENTAKQAIWLMGLHVESRTDTLAFGELESLLEELSFDPAGYSLQ